SGSADASGVWTMNRRLVEIRGADAEESLQRIQESLNRARNRRSGAKNLKDGLEKLCYGDGSITAIDGLIRYCKDIARKLQSAWPDLQPKIMAAEKGLADLNDKHLALLWNASELTKGSSNEGQLGFHHNRTESLIDEKKGTLKRIRADARQPAYT